MAAKGLSGIKIRIAGDTTDLQRALREVNSTARSLSLEMRQVENALKLDPTNVTLLAQRQQLLSEQVKNTSDKLQQLRSVQAQVEQQYRNGDIGAEAYRAFQRELASTESKLASLEQEEKNVVKVSDEAKTKTTQFGDALSGLKAAGSAAASTIGSVASAVTDVMAATVEGAVEAGKAAAGVGISFESSISQLAATMGKTSDQVTVLSDKAEELGAKTQFSASQAAEAFNILAMSGLTTEEQLAAAEDVLNLAAAGSLGLAQAASYTTGAIKGFGDTMDNAQKYTDLMAKGATLASTDVNSLGAALTGAAATASSYGQSADGVTLALLRLAEQNVTGSEAATSMNRAMADLYTPTSEAKEALEELGISAYDQAGNARDFNTVIDELNASMSGLTEEQRNAYKNTIFTTNGLNAFNKMTASSVEKVNALREGLADANGSAAAQAETMNNNLQGDIKILQSAAEGLGIAFYKTFNDDLRSSVQLATESLSDLKSAFEIGGIEGAADAVGKILIDLATQAAELAPTLIEAGNTLFSSLSTALTESAPELTRIASSMVTALADGIAQNGATILNAAAVIADDILIQLPTILGSVVSSAGSFATSIVDFLSQAVVIVGKNLPKIFAFLSQSLVAEVPALTASLLDFIAIAVDTVLTLLPPVLADAVSLVANLLPVLIPQITDTVIDVVQSIVTSLPDILQITMTDILPMLLGGISTLIQSLALALPNLIISITDMIPTLIDSVLSVLLSNLPVVISAFISLLTSITKALPPAIAAITEAMPAVIDGIIAALIDSIPLLIECGIELHMALIEALPQIIANIVSAEFQIIGSMIKAFTTDTPKMKQAGKDLITSLVEEMPKTVLSLASRLGNTASKLVRMLGNALADQGGRLIGIGGNILRGLWEGMSGQLGWIVDMIKGMSDTIVNAFIDFFDIHSPSHRIEDEVGVYNGLALGTGFVKSMPKVRDMISSAAQGLYDTAINPTVSLVPSDERMQLRPTTPARGTTYGDMNFTLHIDNFNNNYGSSMADLSNAFGSAAYDYVRRMKLSL